MGSIDSYVTTDGKRYKVRYRKPDRSQGAKRGFRTKRDAELFLATVEVKKAIGEFIDESAGKVSVSVLGTAWLEQQVHWKSSSRVAYESAWRVHVNPEWGTRTIASVTPSEVQAWLARLRTGDPRAEIKGKSPTIVRRCHDILAGICDDAVSNRRISRNPARGVKLPRRVRKEHVYLSHTQVDKLAEASGSNALVVRILSYTGLRWGELAGLHIGDVDLFRRRLTVNRTASLVGGYIEVGSPKDYERRSVPFPPFLANALTKQCSGKPPSSILFPDRAGGYRRTPTVHDSSWYDSAKLASGLPASLTIHDLRHTAASLAISAGANVKAVQHMLGHASAAMTLDTYADLFPDDLDDVSIALDKARTASVVSKMCPPSDPMKEQKTP